MMIVCLYLLPLQMVKPKKSNYCLIFDCNKRCERTNLIFIT